MNEYIKRYFDGTLSEAEELRLKDFLSSPEDRLLNIPKRAR